MKHNVRSVNFYENIVYFAIVAIIFECRCTRLVPDRAVPSKVLYYVDCQMAGRHTAVLKMVEPQFSYFFHWKSSFIHEATL